VVWIKDVHDISEPHSVLEKILSKSVQSPSKVVLIVTGQDHSISGFIPGVHANFQVPHIFRLPDYTDEELRKILVAMICRTNYAKPIRSGEETGNEESQSDDRDKSDNETEPDGGVEGGFDGPYFQTFTQLISRRRKAPDFENAKTLRECFSKLDRRRIERLKLEDTEKNADLKDTRRVVFTKADMLGEEEEELGKRSSAWQELQSMIGLEEVKASVRMLFGQARINHYRELQGKPPIKITLNRCFLGPPGTGKTTVAKLFGNILYDIGLVERDTVVIKPASDLVGGYIGHSEMYTTNALEDTEGGVLVIDDVHLLLPGATYDTGHEGNTDISRAAVIDTLVAKLQAKPGERRAVILIGYTYVMHELLETSNPGLARRFPMEEAFQFTEYNDDQLCQILELNLHRESLDASPEAVKVAREMLSIARQRPNFGNAGHVENLLSQAKASYVARISPMDPLEGSEQGLQPGDFDPDFDRALKARERFDELFGDMQGMGDIKRQFQGYQDVAARLKIRGHDPRPYIPLAFVFKGPPGTGKTTVARKVGKIFYDMGFLAAPDLIECSVSELVSPYRAAAGEKVIRMFERALGKVLFIDEAYRLGEMGAVDAVGEIVDCMTKERFARKLVIILAGYKDDMNDLMRLNRGLRSRFATDVIFGRMQPEESLAFLKKLVAKLDVQLNGLTPPDTNILRISERLARTKSWANGRDVEAFSREVVEYAFIEKAAAVDPSSKVVVTAKELLPLFKRRLARAYREDAEIAGIHGAGKHSDWADEESDASNWTGGSEHEGIGLAAPDTSRTSQMILSNHNPNGDFQQDQLKPGGRISEDPDSFGPRLVTTRADFSSFTMTN
jgi:AAA+ superfamily predicted ATPase